MSIPTLVAFGDDSGGLIVAAISENTDIGPATVKYKWPGDSALSRLLTLSQLNTSIRGMRCQRLAWMATLPRSDWLPVNAITTKQSPSFGP